MFRFHCAPPAVCWSIPAEGLWLQALGNAACLSLLLLCVFLRFLQYFANIQWMEDKLVEYEADALR